VKYCGQFRIAVRWHIVSSTQVLMFNVISVLQFVSALWVENSWWTGIGRQACSC